MDAQHLLELDAKAWLLTGGRIYADTVARTYTEAMRRMVQRNDGTRLVALVEKSATSDAAPDLLEALQLVVDKLGSDFELYREQQFAIDVARAAIAKATGA